MKLSLSNLAIPTAANSKVFDQLKAAGLSGIEVAPTRIADWKDLSSAKLTEFRTKTAESGLSVSSLQAILFGVANVALLDTVDRFQLLADHMKRVAEIAAELGASVVVFGSPKQRARGELSKNAAFTLGVERFSMLANITQANGVAIGLEPVPAEYGGTFLETWQKTLEMVKAVDHPGLRVHLDTGCVLLGDGDITEAISESSEVLAHFHIAEPRLGAFDEPIARHDKAADALHRIGYSNWAAIEMLEVADEPLKAALEATRFARSCYKL